MQGVETIDIRLSKRTSFREEVGIELSATSGAEAGVSLLRSGRGIDISSSGMGLETDFRPEKGSILKLLVPLSGSDIKMPVFAQVQWVVAAGVAYRAGLQFLA